MRGVKEAAANKEMGEAREKSERGIWIKCRVRSRYGLLKKKPKLDNAPELRVIYFIDLEDGEYKETIFNANKLEIPMEAAMNCKMGTKKRSKRLRQTACETTEHNKKTKHACIVEAHESRRKRLESTLLRDHEDHIAEKRFNSIWCTSWLRSPKR